MPEDVEIGLRVDAREVDNLTKRFQKAEGDVKKNFEAIRRTSNKELEAIAKKGNSVAQRFSRAFPGAEIKERTERAFKRPVADINRFATALTRVTKASDLFQSQQTRLANQAKRVDAALGKNVRSVKAFQSAVSSPLRLTRQGFLNQIGATRARERQRFGRVLPGSRLTGPGEGSFAGLDSFGSKAKQAFEEAEKEGEESAEEVRRSWVKNLERIERRLRGFASRLKSQRSGAAGFASPLQQGPEATTTNRVAAATNRILERTSKLFDRIRRQSRRARSAIVSFASAGRRGARRFNQTLRGMARRLGRVFSILGRLRTRLTVLFSGVVFGTATRLFRNFLSAIVNFGKRAEISIVQLGTLFRTSRRDATGFFQAIREFARPLPATTEDVVSAFIRLKSVGVDPTARSIQALINASIALGRPLSNIVLGVQSLETESLRKLGINLNRRGDTAILAFGAERIEIEKDDTKIREALLELFNRAFAGALEDSLKNFQVALDVFRSVLGDFFVPAGLSLLEKSLTRIVGLTSAWLSENRKIVESRILLFVERLGATLNDFATPERIDKFLDSLTQFIATDLPRFLGKVGDLFEYVFDNIGRIVEETARFAKIALPLVLAVTGAIAGSAFGPIGTVVGGVAGGIGGAAITSKLTAEIEALRLAISTENERRLVALQGRRQELVSGSGGDPFSRRGVGTRNEIEEVDRQIKTIEGRIEAEKKLEGEAGKTTRDCP